jgi:enoyl-CoA hydratase/carnithine racemase
MTGKTSGTAAEDHGASFVEYDVRDRIAYLWLNRPDRLNAFTDQGIDDIVRALERFDDDDDAHVAILAGRGRAFSSGADVKARLGSARGSRARPHFTSDAAGFFECTNWKPIIAAVHGFVIGNALVTAFSSDLVVAEAGTILQIPEPALNAPIGGFISLLSSRAIDPFVMEISLTGRRWSAEEALAHGLIHSVAPQGQVVTAAEALARRIIEDSAPVAVRAAVAVRRRMLWKQICEGKTMTLGNTRWWQSEDFAEGVAAKIEKRKPKFTGQ